MIKCLLPNSLIHFVQVITTTTTRRRFVLRAFAVLVGLFAVWNIQPNRNALMQTTPSQPAGVALNPNGISTLGGVFDISPWTETTGASGHVGDDSYARDYARACGDTAGHNLYAGISGVVHRKFYGATTSYGNSLVIYDAATKMALRYAHLAEYAPNMIEGARVDAGEYIGKVGNTGNTGTAHGCTINPGAHLHLVLYRNVTKMDDYPIDKTTTSSDPTNLTYAADYRLLSNRIAPSAPTGLRAIPGTSSSMVLRWNYDRNLDSFLVERREGSGAFTSVGSVDKSQHATINSGLSASTNYCYRIKAIRGDQESVPSNVSCADTLDPDEVAPPIIDPDEGNYVGAVSVSMTTGTSGATIRYTTNGSTPTSTSPVYSGSFTLTSSTTVKAKAFKSGLTASDVSITTFTISTSSPGPSPSPSVGPTVPVDRDAPRNVIATVVSSTKIKITWDYDWPSLFDAPDRIEIERQEPDGRWVGGSLSNGYKTYGIQDPDVKAGTKYKYRAYAAWGPWNAPTRTSGKTESNEVTTPTCNYSLSNPGVTDFGVNGGTGRVTLNAPAGCEWQAASNDPTWIGVSPTSGVGSRTIEYWVNANVTPANRSGSFAIADQTVRISQTGSNTFRVSRFDPSSTYNVFSGQWHTGDFNGDGRTDLIHLTDSDYVHVWLSLGEGNFDPRQFRPWGGYSIQSGTWLPGDINGDGRTDMVHVTDASYLNVWISKGDGSFTVNAWAHSDRYNNRSGRWIIGDINGDGRADPIHLPEATYMHPWISRGDGTFDVKQFAPWPGYAVYLGSFMAADFNGDGRTDLIHFVNRDYVHVWLSKGDGTFTVLGGFSPWAGYHITSGKWLAGDINGDGRSDLVHVINDYAHPWISKGNGEFAVGFFRPFVGYGTRGEWRAADLDGDGRTDLVHLVPQDYVHPWLSKGDGTFAVSRFSPAPKYSVGSGWWLTGDFNGDRKTDLVHLTQSTYVHPWTSGADQSTYGYILAAPSAPGAPAPACPGCPVNPDVTVWVNSASGFYRCRGMKLYGKTKLGQFMKQKAAQDSGYRKAYGGVCRN